MSVNNSAPGSGAPTSGSSAASVGVASAAASVATAAAANAGPASAVHPAAPVPSVPPPASSPHVKSSGTHAQQRVTPLTGVLMTDSHGGLVVRRVRVRVTSGQDRGREAMLEAGTLLVGTHGDNDLVLKEATVGKYHLELALVAAGVRVRDVGGEGATLVNGTRVTQTVVPTSTEIIIGRASLQLIAADLSVPIPASERSSFGPVLGRCAPMREIFGLLERIAPTDVPVLLEGRPGCGKTLIAKAIHAASRFAASPLVVLDFGPNASERPAIQHVAQRSDTFTLLIDNIDQAPSSAISDLLHLYERREEGVLDARIIATASPGLRVQPGDNRARRELLAHVAAVRIPVPSLDARVEDIPGLVRQFAREVCGVEPSLQDDELRHIVARGYPGGVKELRQLVVKALANEPSPRAMLPRSGLARARAALVLPLNARPKPPDPKAARDRMLEAFERDWLLRSYTRFNGDLNEVMRDTELSKPDLQKLLKHHGIGEQAAPPPAPATTGKRSR